MTDNERIKLEKDGLDVYENLIGYAKTGFHTITPEDMMLFRWYGIYEQKPKEGHFMMRIKVTNGDMTAEQARVVADISRLYGQGITDVTTRQNFQFHWLTIEDFPDILERLGSVGITTSGACGDITRNVTGCPVAGIDRQEVFDARPWGTQIHEHFLGNKEFSNLPRKYKVSVSGCSAQCAMPEINDIGAVGVKRLRANGQEELGFHMRVGGGLSARPFISKRLNMFIPQDKLLSVAIATTEIFRDFGNRDNRKAARLKFLVNDWGIERFEQEVRDRLDWNPDEAADWPEAKKHFRDHVGVHAQKQEGFYWVGATILTGRLSDAQLTEIARISEVFGDGNLRTTIQQNVLLPNVPQGNVDGAVAALEAIDLQTTPSTFRRAAIACTGNQFCNLALTETKGLLREIVDHVEQNVAMDELIRININGCPNDCGHHHIGDIGLQGCLVKKGGGVVVEGYDLALGGRLGREAKFVRAIRRKVPATEVKFAIENLLKGYSGAKDDEEDFSDFVDRHSDDELAALMKTDFAEGVPTEVQRVGCAVD